MLAIASCTYVENAWAGPSAGVSIVDEVVTIDHGELKRCMVEGSRSIQPAES
jgi:hypothetical protein